MSAKSQANAAWAILAPTSAMIGLSGIRMQEVLGHL